MEERKKIEAEFHNKWRDEKLRKNNPDEDKRLSFSKKFYSITRASWGFLNGWILERCKNTKVLDYCCGDGDFSIFLAKNKAKVTGIDISSVSIKRAKRESINQGVEENTSFLVMDAEKLEFPDNYFDIIVCNGVLHHLDIKKAYPELMRVIKLDGKIICDEPLFYNPIFQLYRKMTPHLRTRWEMEHILTKKEIELARKYFNNVETRFFHLFTLMAVPFRNLKSFNSILGFFERVDSILLKLPVFKWLAWQVIFILSKPKK